MRTDLVKALPCMGGSTPSMYLETAHTTATLTSGSQRAMVSAGELGSTVLVITEKQVSNAPAKRWLKLLSVLMWGNQVNV